MESKVRSIAKALYFKSIINRLVLNRILSILMHPASKNEQEFTEMVKGEREAEQAVCNVSSKLTEKQIKGRDFSRSLYVVKDIKKGEVITDEHVISIRP